jgi:Fe-S-cluster containining protein
MSRGTGQSASTDVSVRVVISVNGRPVRIETRVPDRKVRLDELLPALRTIDDRLIDAVVETVEANGERVSCAKGCSTCCRAQPVPVTPPEAFALASLVERLPEPRRAKVRAGFAAAAERLRAAGLYDTYMRRDPALTREAARAVARRYFALSIACPFLEDDACSIYADRPFVCRQYLVTSPPDLCQSPLDNPVKPVRAPAAFATAMLAVGKTLSGRAQYTVPLVLALDCARESRTDLARTYDAKTAFGHVLRILSSRSHSPDAADVC